MHWPREHGGTTGNRMSEVAVRGLPTLFRGTGTGSPGGDVMVTESSLPWQPLVWPGHKTIAEVLASGKLQPLLGLPDQPVCPRRYPATQLRLLGRLGGYVTGTMTMTVGASWPCKVGQSLPDGIRRP